MRILIIVGLVILLLIIIGECLEFRQNLHVYTDNPLAISVPIIVKTK